MIVAACLGAEEYGFATAPLIALGCVMMRKCHLNTCPVGIATQDPVLRAQFTGTPEHVVNYLFFVAEEVREHLSRMGFRTLDEIIGRADLLSVSDLRAPLEGEAPRPRGRSSRCPRCPTARRSAASSASPTSWPSSSTGSCSEVCKDAVEHQKRVQRSLPITNRNRTVGTLLSYFVTAKHGEHGLREDTIDLQFTGSAGQSFGAFLTRGITLRVRGDANDYVGKGLSGGKLIVAPAAGGRLSPPRRT